MITPSNTPRTHTLKHNLSSTHFVPPIVHNLRLNIYVVIENMVRITLASIPLVNSIQTYINHKNLRNNIVLHFHSRTQKLTI